ncbi:MAG: radical SAM protein [Thermoplasmatota archaeon]
MITILDGYTDEPSCLGVPPYIAPSVRYAGGAIASAGHQWQYRTIDQWRSGASIDGDTLLVIAGALVPGRYLRGMPISYNELKKIAESFSGTVILGGASARYGLGRGGGKTARAVTSLVDYAASGDVDAFIYDFLYADVRQRQRTLREWREWSAAGSQVVTHHPDFPQPLVAEIETFRGCPRYITGGCSFCMEPEIGKPTMREVEDIVAEVQALYQCGVRNFRLGGQSCFYSYGAHGMGRTEVPEPDVGTIKKLLTSIHQVAPQLHVLHTDNANPAVLSEHPEKARKITELIVAYCTAGNTAALGMETADERVIEENNLNATPEQTLKAIEIINEKGKKRGRNGLPAFLPGINILYGLPGESTATYAKNLKFLHSVKEAGWWLRRVNIRQVVAIRLPRIPVNPHLFYKFKKTVNEQINRPLLQKIVPYGTVLRDVFLEINRGNTTFGRQSGSYPLLVCLPYKKPLRTWTDVKILDHGYRSVTGIEYPLSINKASLDALSQLPTVGLKRAARIIQHRPFGTTEEVQKALDKQFDIQDVASWISFS